MNWNLDLNTVHFAQHPRRSEGSVGNQFFVDVEFPKAGVPLFPHTHPYPHVSRATLGRVAVWIAGTVHLLDAGLPNQRGVAVPADVVHSAMGLDDGACMTCTHILRDDKGIIYPFEYKLTVTELMAATGRA